MGQVHGGSQEGTGGCNGDTEGAHPQSVQSLPKSQMLYSEPFPPSSQSPSSWWRHSWLQPPCVEDDNTSSASPHHQPPCSIHAEHSVGVSVAEDMKAHKNPATQPMMVQKARPRKRAARSSIGGTRHPVRSLASDEASPMTRSAHTLSFAKRAPRSPRSLPSPQPKSERSFFSTLLRLEKWVDTISATVCQDRLPERHVIAEPRRDKHAPPTTLLLQTPRVRGTRLGLHQAKPRGWRLGSRRTRRRSRSRTRRFPHRRPLGKGRVSLRLVVC